jgi:outer membrane protein OmpA-like peptidoglycan-associated protein
MHELPVEEKVNLRYNVLFEFNDAKSIKMSEKFLSEVVVPSIPDKATVIIRGYTDITGSEANNQSLSLARANAVHSILKKSLAASNRTDVQFEVYGEGENDKTSPFNNTYPEDRAYNRTVVIDINKSL